MLLNTTAFLNPLDFLAFGLGSQEVLLVFLIVLLLFGAKKLPQLAKGLGRSLGEFRKAKDEFEDEINRAGDEVNKEIEEAKHLKTSDRS